MFANPRLPAGEIEQRYSSDYIWNEYLPGVVPPAGPNDSAFLDWRYRKPLALLRQRTPNAGRLLEIGTGAGFFLKAAVRAGWDAYGLELSPDAAAYARDTLRALLLNAGFRRVRFVTNWHPLYSGAMNAQYTHAPNTTRALVYRRFVWYVGRFIFRGVEALGLGDSLVVLADA